MGITVELDTKMAAGFTEVTSLVLMNCSCGELLCNTRNPFRNYELKRAIYTNNYTTIYTTIYAVVEVCAGLKSQLFFFSKLVCTSLVECCPVLYLSLLHSERKRTRLN